MERTKRLASRRSSSAISRTIRIASVINFTINEIPKIMETLKVDKNNYAIGGSVAGILYGVDFNRIPHDIDIIVPQGYIDLLQLRIEYSPLFTACPSTSSIDAEFKTKHFAFKAINGPDIDIIEYDKFYDENNKISYCDKINVMSIDRLIEAKQKYNRFYDEDDLKALCSKAYNMKIDYIINDASGSDNDIDKEVSETEAALNNPLGDLDALAELKAKMEDCKNE